MQGYNVLSDEKHREVMFNFDLQLFGGGGGGKGGGTAFGAAIPGLEVCGKTGTAQNPHGKDNSVFICFAPRENPRIAVAAYLENAGFGATWACPIASLMIEKYLTGSIREERLPLEDRMKKTVLIGK